MTFTDRLKIASFATCVFATTTVGAHGSNPNHLESWINNPFDSQGRITQTAPGHWVVYKGDVSTDIAYPKPGEVAGKKVYFKGEARNSKNSFRGKIVEGGLDGLLSACKSGDVAEGGYRVKVQIEVRGKRDTNWTNVGWAYYSHVEKPTWYNGTYINAGEKVSSVWSGKVKNIKCWDAPHLHLEVYEKAHDAGYVSRSKGSAVDTNGHLFCVGGTRSGIKTC